MYIRIKTQHITCMLIVMLKVVDKQMQLVHGFSLQASLVFWVFQLG
jgi:hypothetical protein